ncbi:hypothetical protein TsFJ059_005733 [Trichoderma semiorbis]|uniref:Uncharacterized protein n=1 Tax=Trichoderma semiorbis TaxID=1491008 RepID=A0A9P8KLD8_9HYPO|nr:hypothetical protein TsFJ059_005733 [Trichoderma semiorbis]
MEQVQPPALAPPSPQVPPPRPLEIATLVWNKNKRPFADAVACVEAYWAHASQMDAETQEHMIQHISRGHCTHTRSSLKQASSHRLYKAAMKDHAKNTWPVYLILNAMYNTLPDVGCIKPPLVAHVTSEIL